MHVQLYPHILTYNFHYFSFKPGTHDSWADIDNNYYERVAGYQRKRINVSLALGGWNDSQGDKYSRLVRSPSARKRFVAQAVQFLEKYGFNGLDLGKIVIIAFENIVL